MNVLLTLVLSLTDFTRAPSKATALQIRYANSETIRRMLMVETANYSFYQGDMLAYIQHTKNIICVQFSNNRSYREIKSILQKNIHLSDSNARLKMVPSCLANGQAKVYW